MCWCSIVVVTYLVGKVYLTDKEAISCCHVSENQL